MQNVFRNLFPTFWIIFTFSHSFYEDKITFFPRQLSITLSCILALLAGDAHHVYRSQEISMAFAICATFVKCAFVSATEEDLCLKLPCRVNTERVGEACGGILIRI